jgi:4-hydroxy-4-methyl-2-oxoglutarate aldolase
MEQRREPEVSKPMVRKRVDLDAWIGVASALAYSAAGESGDMSPDIRQLVPGVRLLGRAFTVKCLVGDILAANVALDMADKGDVLVIDAGGTSRATAWGAGTCTYAVHRGLAGVVTNGAIRDIDEIIALSFPVYGVGTSVRGALKQHPGWIGVPISMGGVVVNPGDLIIGDSDGVIVIGADREEEARNRLPALKEMERRQIAGIRNARSFLALQKSLSAAVGRP